MNLKDEDCEQNLNRTDSQHYTVYIVALGQNDYYSYLLIKHTVSCVVYIHPIIRYD